MEQFNQKEFEENLRKIMDGELTKTQLAQQMHIDPRKLDKMIQQLHTTNFQLYLQFTAKCPIKPKTTEHIDYEALVIYILKNEITLQQAVAKFGVGERTIRRQIDALENTSPEIYELYKATSPYRSAKKSYPEDIAEQINELKIKAVIVEDGVNKKMDFLKNVIEEYDEKCKTMPHEEAAKQMGITTSRIAQYRTRLKVFQTQQKAKSEKEMEL